MKRLWAAPALLLVCLPCAPGPRRRRSTIRRWDRCRPRWQARPQAIRAEEVPTGEAPSLVAQQVLGPIHSVEMPGQAPQPVDTGRLIAALKAAEAVHDPDEKLRRFGSRGSADHALRSEIVTAGGADRRPPDPVATVQSARAVLAGAEFGSDPPPPPTLAERFAAWLDRMLARLQPAESQHAECQPAECQPECHSRHLHRHRARRHSPCWSPSLCRPSGGAAHGPSRWRWTRKKRRWWKRGTTTACWPWPSSRRRPAITAAPSAWSISPRWSRWIRAASCALTAPKQTGNTCAPCARRAGAMCMQAMTPLTREFDQVWYGFARTDASHYARALAQYQALLAAPQGPGGSAGGEQPDARQPRLDCRDFASAGLCRRRPAARRARRGDGPGRSARKQGRTRPSPMTALRAAGACFEWVQELGYQPAAWRQSWTRTGPGGARTCCW